MNYTNQMIKTIHTNAIQFLKGSGGVVEDLHRDGGKITLTHVGIFLQTQASGNPLLVGLIDGVLTSLNHLLITSLPDGSVMGVSLSKESVGGILGYPDLPMEERYKSYNKDLEGIPGTGRILELIEI